MDEEALVTVSTHGSVLEAELAKSLLEGDGIYAFIHAPHSHDLYPGVLGEVMLQVRERDLKRAREILKSGTLSHDIDDET